jgi:RecG-like helicase
MTPNGINDVARRVKAMVSSTDGFKTSRGDLQIADRAAGTRQSGIPGFVARNLFTDAHLLSSAQKEAERGREVRRA